MLRSGIFSNTQKATLVRIEQRYSEWSGYARTVAFTVLVVDEGGGGAWAPNQRKVVAANNFARRSASGRFRLVTEDGLDGEFVARASLQLASILGYGGRFEYEVVRGGGSRTGATYCDHAVKGRPTYCVVDSDARYSSDGAGATARDALRRHNRLDEALSKLHVLGVREIECLVPTPIVRRTYANDSSMIDRTRVIRALEVAADGGDALAASALAYVSRKNGCSSSTSVPIEARNLCGRVNQENGGARWRGYSPRMLENVVRYLRERGDDVPANGRDLEDFPFATELSGIASRFLSFSQAAEPEYVI